MEEKGWRIRVYHLCFDGVFSYIYHTHWWCSVYTEMQRWALVYAFYGAPRKIRAVERKIGRERENEWVSVWKNEWMNERKQEWRCWVWYLCFVWRSLYTYTHNPQFNLVQTQFRLLAMVGRTIHKTMNTWRINLYAIVSSYSNSICTKEEKAVITYSTLMFNTKSK